jgi:zinc/manganese transport system substrate-binding protein
MRHLLRTTSMYALVSVAFLAVAACGTSNSSDEVSDPANAGNASSASLEAINVVASTNVYGDIAKQIGGDKVKVTSFITDPGQDPHSYEVNTQNQLALSKAKVVIENGGGYDDFVDTMLKTAGNDSTVLLNAVTISGKTAPAGGALNEHVWYDLPTVTKLADQISAALGKADSAGAAGFTANAEAFKQKIQPLIDREASMASTAKGSAVAITEPVPFYLLEASGLENVTTGEFSEAIEEGADVSPKILQDTLALFTGKKVKALFYNEQTAGAQTDKVKQAATDNGIPVIPVTETLPAGKDYIGWMTGNLDAVQKALGL